jgi:hypothetical protein
MFSAALAHVQRNYVALLIYAGITAGFYAAKLAVESWLITDITPNDLDAIGKIYLIVSGLVSAAVYAVAQTVVFSKMGEDIERPIWKASSIPSPFLRFWSFWFTINLLNISSLLIIAVVPMEASARDSLQLFWLFGQTILVPFGAATMYFGNTTTNEMRLASHTLIAQLPHVALICFISLSVEVTLIGMQGGLPTPALPALAVIDSYAACFIFAYTWEICRKHREEEENADDLDF